MVSADIEKLKLEYTDKYVVVDARRPELARFAEAVGQVKTVNMSGRALVEFLDYHLNMGWYDIDLGYLKLVDKPLPKVKEKKEEKKPVAKKADEAAPAAKPAAKADGKPSVAEMLAMARGGAKGVPASPPAEAGSPAAPTVVSTGGKVDRAKMSVAEMLAAARGGAKVAPVPPPAEAASPAAELEPVPAPVDASAPAPVGMVKVDKSAMSVAQMLAYCRQHDAH